MDEIGPNEYRCAACGNVYEKGWSDEQAEAEMIRIKFANSNTSSCTLGDALAAFPPIDIKKNGTDALMAGDIIAGVVTAPYPESLKPQTKSL